MAEAPYYEFQGGLDQGNISHISNFSGRSEPPNYDPDGHGKPGPGFYTEHFTGMSSGLGGHEMMSNQGGLTDGHSQDIAVPQMMMSPEAVYGAHLRSYSMKTEKGMPPTPPGSPDDPKVTPGMSNQEPGHHLNMAQSNHLGGVSQPDMSTLQQHYLAKPVPMRRLSEKRIAQTRACISSVASAMVASDPLGDSSFSPHNSALARALATVQHSQKRPRSEKKPIPVEAKDDKYYERRKRNNSAAKKSRDARKCREDEIAIRASYLEKENAVLRAQVATLREEANSLRQLLLQKRSRP